MVRLSVNNRRRKLGLANRKKNFAESSEYIKNLDLTYYTSSCARAYIHTLKLS